MIVLLLQDCTVSLMLSVFRLPRGKIGSVAHAGGFVRGHRDA